MIPKNQTAFGHEINHNQNEREPPNSTSSTVPCLNYNQNERPLQKSSKSQNTQSNKESKNEFSIETINHSPTDQTKTSMDLPRSDEPTQYPLSPSINSPSNEQQQSDNDFPMSPSVPYQRFPQSPELKTNSDISTTSKIKPQSFSNDNESETSDDESSMSDQDDSGSQTHPFPGVFPTFF